METRPAAEKTDEAVFEDHEVEVDQPFFYVATAQTPWWIVSILFHALMITLCGLISMSVSLPDPGDLPIVVTTLEPRTNDIQVAPTPPPPSNSALIPIKATQTDPNGPDPLFEVTITDTMRAMAELSDHFETENPDLPDKQSARGNPLAHMFYLRDGNIEPGGGGGSGGTTLDSWIGVGGDTSPGTGGGWGGGNGRGHGVDNGDCKGSFSDRLDGSGRKLRIIRTRGGDMKGETCVQRGLRWLAYHQEADGHWDSVKYTGRKVDTANTALALLAFLGAGHTEKVGEYKDNVKRAVAWLKSKQAANGLVFDTTDEGAHRGIGYPGAIATLALAEAAGMANVSSTREAAQKAVDYCTEIHQQGEGSDKLGFRYTAKSAGDISVTGWFVMALKSAKVAGLKVNHAAFDGVIQFLDKVEVKNAGGDSAYGPASRYSYQPGGTPNHRRCAIGNLCRQFLGWKKDDLQSSVELFVREGGVPAWGANGESVDLYYWYYGTFCTFQQGGSVWKTWNEAMKKALIENQCAKGDDAGSWSPVGEFSGEWGRVGQTALSALCLEVYYRYDLMSK